MKKILLLFTILFVSVITTACINNLAIQELNNKAESYLNNGDTETAICRLKSSLDLDDEIYQTHYNLAIAYNTIGNYKESIQESQKVVEFKPDFKIAYYTMAVAQEAYAYEIIENVQDNNELTLDEIANFISRANDAGVAIISSMGTGNKLGYNFEIADIKKTSVCPLAKVMRRELKARGINSLPVLYSKEEPITPINPVVEKGRHIPASISYPPAIAGLMIGGFVIRSIIGR